jgi:antitoxin component YwqK of YwqJK toxin-antitoxin module
MKTSFLVILFFLYAFIISAQTVNFDILTEGTDFLKYMKNEKEPFTGTAVKYYSPKRQKFIIEYTDGLENGRAAFFFEDGSAECTGYYTDGMEDSTWVWFYPNGKLKAKGSYVSGIAQGYWEYYNQFGIKERSGIVMQGKEHGKWFYWNEKGNLLTERFYQYGVKDSTETWYYPTGQPMILRRYTNGLENGVFSGWFENGRKQFEGNARNGEVIRYIEWDINGKALKIHKISD